MARIQKGQSYPDLGFSVDGNGIATDLTTGKTLAKSVVDQRLSGSGYSQLAKERGGIAGVYDRNKAAIPAIQTAVAMLPGIGPLISAGIGGLRGFDRPGEGGIGYDVGTGLKGAATGYAAGMTGDALGGALSKGLGAFKAAGGGLGGVGAGLKKAGSSLIPGLIKSATGGGTGLPGMSPSGVPGVSNSSDYSNPFGSIGDFLTGNNGLNALATAQGANAALLGKKSSEYAENAMKTQNDLWDQRAGLRSSGITGMMAPRTALPQLGVLSQGGNPFAQPQPSLGSSGIAGTPSGTPAPVQPIPQGASGVLGGAPPINNGPQGASGTLHGVGAMPAGQTIASLLASIAATQPKPPANQGTGGMMGSIQGSSPDGMTFAQAVAKQKQSQGAV